MSAISSRLPDMLRQLPAAAHPLSMRMRLLTGVMLALLAAQFFIGMLVNLFVQVPAAHPGSGAANYFVGVAQGVFWTLGHGGVSLQLHAWLGLALFLLAILLIALAILRRERAWIILTILGLLGIMAAGFNGASFLNYGHDVSSLLMSSGFLLTTVAYVVGVGLPCARDAASTPNTANVGKAHHV